MPEKRPITAISAELNNCWNKLVRAMGMANTIILSHIEPSSALMVLLNVMYCCLSDTILIYTAQLFVLYHYHHYTKSAAEKSTAVRQTGI